MATEMSQSRKAPELSPREQELIQLASEGLTDTAIAYRLGISEATVGTYWGRVRIKIGPYNRTELVSLYLRAKQEEALEQIQIENAQVVAALREAAAADSGQAALYRSLIEHAPDAIFIVSDNGTITEANQAAHELFGYEPSEMNGLALIELVPVRLREVHQEHRADYVNNPKRRTMGEHLQTPAVRKNGEEFQVRAALSAIPSTSGLVVTCVVRPAEEGSEEG